MHTYFLDFSSSQEYLGDFKMKSFTYFRITPAYHTAVTKLIVFFSSKTTTITPTEDLHYELCSVESSRLMKSRTFFLNRRLYVLMSISVDFFASPRKRCKSRETKLNKVFTNCKLQYLVISLSYK